MKKGICIILCLFLCPLTVSAASKQAKEETVQAEKTNPTEKDKKDKGTSKEKEAKGKTITLHFRPKEQVKERPKEVPPVKIFFDAFRDDRPQPKEIGENVENKDKRVLITTDEEHAASQFVHSVLKNEFRDKGFSLAENPGEAQKIIRGVLLKFWTVEERRYRSEIQLKIEVRDKGDHLYYSRTYVGEGTNFGRSLSDVNYQESISEALARMMDHIFADEPLLRALAERPKAVRTEEKPAATAPFEPPLLKEKSAPPPPSKTQKPTGAKPSGPVFGPK